ncbi:hypothetical protein BJ742DRAFT_911604 [Cladochytrium replicatum]|nr:hypothetical protein BJ742DRAFT_911604 [Cladochytrium replicatum]
MRPVQPLDLDTQPFLLLDSKNRPTWNEYKRVATRYEKSLSATRGSPISPFLPNTPIVPPAEFAAPYITERNVKEAERRRSGVYNSGFAGGKVQEEDDVEEISAQESAPRRRKSKIRDQGNVKEAFGDNKSMFLVRKAKLRINVGSPEKQDEERGHLSPGVSTSIVNEIDGSPTPDISWTTCFQPIPLFDFFLIPQDQLQGQANGALDPCKRLARDAESPTVKKSVRLFMRVDASSPTRSVIFPSFARRQRESKITGRLLRASDNLRRLSPVCEDPAEDDYIEEEIEDFDGLLEGYEDIPTHIYRRLSGSSPTVRPNLRLALTMDEARAERRGLGSNSDFMESSFSVSGRSNSSQAPRSGYKYADEDGILQLPPGVNLRPRRRKSAILNSLDAAKEAADRYEIVQQKSELMRTTSSLGAISVNIEKERGNEPDDVVTLLSRVLMVILVIWASLSGMAMAIRPFEEAFIQANAIKEISVIKQAEPIVVKPTQMPVVKKYDMVGNVINDSNGWFVPRSMS